MYKVDIYGLVPASLTDVPGHVSATVFLTGCNLRCAYCYNHHVVEGKSHLTVEELFAALSSSLVKWVCITGGEPTLHRDLPMLCRGLKGAGYKVKLDTNGTNPERLNHLIQGEWVDMVAMDLKARLTFRDYMKVTAISEEMLEEIKLSVSLLIERQDQIKVQFRTTYNFHLYPPTQLESIVLSLRELGFRGEYLVREALDANKSPWWKRPSYTPDGLMAWDKLQQRLDEMAGGQFRVTVKERQKGESSEAHREATRRD